MVTHSSIVTSANDFLAAIRKGAERELGDRVWRTARSEWWVTRQDRPGEGDLRSEERLVVNIPDVLEYFRNTDFPEQRRLEDSLTEAGIPSGNHVDYFLMPLIRHWCELTDPVRFPEIARPVLDEFANAVITGEVVTKSIDAFSSLSLPHGAVELQKGIEIRPIKDKELREFGSENLRSPWNRDPSLLLPFDNWAILDIEIAHPIDSFPNEIRNIRDSALVALVLSKASDFRFIQYGITKSYGWLALARQYEGQHAFEEFGNAPWNVSKLDQEPVDQIKKAWPGVFQIVDSDAHYLRMPSQRLVEGTRRRRLEDALLDFAIGLEALLLRGLWDELSYRFALRGATVLTWDGGDRRKAFDDLHDFYNIRSKIVHGGIVVNPDLSRAKINGEKMLRDIWWWFFKDGNNPDDSIRKIDDRIRS